MERPIAQRNAYQFSVLSSFHKCSISNRSIDFLSENQAKNVSYQYRDPTTGELKAARDFPKLKVDKVLNREARSTKILVQKRRDHHGGIHSLERYWEGA